MDRIAIVLGAMCLVAGVTLWWQDQPSNVGTVDLVPAAVASPAAAAAMTQAQLDDRATPPRTRQPASSPTGTSIPGADADTATPGTTNRRGDGATRRPRVIRLALPAPAVAPVQLRAPRLDLTVPLDAVGLDDDAQMALPTDVRRAGWYRWGPEPGAPGNAVIAGHVDSRTQGLGAFAQLEALVPGDVVETTDRDGATIRWEIIGRQEIDKQEIDPSSLFRREGPPRLVLVTCGGVFDDSARSYRANVVVVARPLR